jgi:ERCC4-type nuclease
MLIKIDTREHELIKKCELLLVAVPVFKDLKIVVQQLPLGDIIISDNQNDNIIVERKTLSDLAASIKDGRYEEQSYRLNGLPLHNHNIVYLIEGDLSKFNSFKERIDKQTIYSAMFSINYFKGFSLARTNTIDETAFMVCNMAYKIGKETSKKPYYQNKITEVESNLVLEVKPNLVLEVNKEVETNLVLEVKESNEKDYCSVIKKVKKDNITIDNIGEIMLCQIPGVSSVSAITILGKFKTLPNLIKSLETDPACLNGISTTDANGKTRKINKTVIATIVNYLSHF